ncbi:Haem-NO-binding [Tenacibaculum sp. MAR_2009_124]|uniref:heme NO-binding domain-containing protein n=1 Tax=Tenacibaculum sp. MAR_2009_124 TaxID=1250059 RepID=UPI00089D9E0B|nr:heme NO-binding domain-containing protein [Tenacibaculum sp. MAR_2009_124]SEB50584.1 Haem-NO-binding [Tenacibaculum sp. MAR_2009_124]
MKGIVFTEFLEMVEKKFGLETVDTIITESNLDSDGAYTSVGTYAFKELQSLVSNLSKCTNINPQDLIHLYGIYFFDVLTKNYINLFDHYKNAFQLISSIEEHIHVEVRKMYPDAELPFFETHESSDSKLVIEYHSERAMYSFAQGLIERSLEHYNENATVTKKLLTDSGTKVLFTIVKNA